MTYQSKACGNGDLVSDARKVQNHDGIFKFKYFLVDLLELHKFQVYLISIYVPSYVKVSLRLIKQKNSFGLLKLTIICKCI